MSRRHNACQTILSAVVCLLTSASPALCQDTKPEIPPANQTTEVSFPTVGIRAVQPVGFRKYVQGEIPSELEGFHHPGTGSNIRALSVPARYSASVVHAIVSELQNRGYSFDSGKPVNIDGREGVLFLTGSTNKNRVNVSMWILLFDGGDDTKTMYAGFPSSQHSEFAERLKSALLATKRLAATDETRVTDSRAVLPPQEQQ